MKDTKMYLFGVLLFLAGTVSCSLEADDIAVVEVVNAAKPTALSLKQNENRTGCSCIHYDCGCCADFDFPKIGLNDTGCLNVTYLPKPDYGISVLFSINGVIYYNKTVSVKNPPPLCFGIPHLKELASVCIHFYDITFNESSLHMCVDIEARLKFVIVEKYHLGCFQIPPSEAESKTVIRIGQEEWKDTALKYIPRKTLKTIFGKDWKKIGKQVSKPKDHGYE